METILKELFNNPEIIDSKLNMFDINFKNFPFNNYPKLFETHFINLSKLIFIYKGFNDQVIDKYINLFYLKLKSMLKLKDFDLLQDICKTGWKSSKSKIIVADFWIGFGKTVSVVSFSISVIEVGEPK